jgi:hypothetical protein
MIRMFASTRISRERFVGVNSLPLNVWSPFAMVLPEANIAGKRVKNDSSDVKALDPCL